PLILCCTSSSLLELRRPPTPPLFPYTTLFRSKGSTHRPKAVTLCRHNEGSSVYFQDQLRHTLKGFKIQAGVAPEEFQQVTGISPDRKSTRLNSSHVKISYAVFCLKKKI